MRRRLDADGVSTAANGKAPWTASGQKGVATAPLI